MEQISTEKLFGYYKDTLDKCGVYLLNQTDDIIEYNIFEEFDIGIHSFFYPDNLLRLLNAELISLERMNKSLKLREMVIKMQNSEEWNVASLRASENWKTIMVMSDELKTME